MTNNEQALNSTFDPPVPHKPVAEPFPEAFSTPSGASVSEPNFSYLTPSSNEQPKPYKQPHGSEESPYNTYGQENRVPQSASYGYAQSGGYGQFGTQQTQAHTFNSGYGTVIPLRPMGIGDTLDATFRLLKFNPVAYFVFPLILFLISGTVDALLSLSSGEIDTTNPFGAALNSSMALLGRDFLISLIISLFVGYAVVIVTTRITIASVRGRKVSLKESFTLLKPQGGILFLRLLAFSAITFAVMALAVIITFTIGMLIFTVSGFESATADSDSLSFSVLAAGLGIFAVFIALMFVLAAFYLRFALTPSIMVAENIGPIKGIGRSWTLTKGSYGYLLGTVLLVGIIATMATMAVTTVFTIAALLAGESGTLGILLSSIGLSVAVSITLTPVQGVLMNLLYINMRFKRENMHLALIADQQG